ncbi:hypothetical protein ES703_57476 [subsurface metagenome]
MRLEIHPSAAKSYALLICTTDEEARWLSDFAPASCKLEATIENPKMYKHPHIIIRKTEVGT